MTKPATLHQPEAPSEEAVRREHEAMEIILLAKDLLDSTKLLTFFETIVTVEADPIKAFQVRQVYSRIPGMNEYQWAKVLTLLWKWAHQDDSNDTPQPICEFQVDIPLLWIKDYPG